MIFYKILSDQTYGGEIELDQSIVPDGYTDQNPGENPFTKSFYNSNWIEKSEVPVAIPVPVKFRRITQLAFITRFTDAEAVGIDLASIGATVKAASVRRYLAKVSAATYIDLTLEPLRSGVIALETAGMIVKGRALEILDAEILHTEIYRGF